ncbi:alcohol dehydrogenase catalytic domain-containing protein [Frondihabitans australicus]|uniref:Alcohol dehydrogenase n=1 Tax=Frondihabitans australicus TaxID=386892 RepID=A0A495IK67_9MICO|nr:alcohol dehydrogenase catalytic domain-containing protein [Frondihabitans australicus]RKR75681.1 propanol-preferring alcohol dehydrogenase [Frondihabitans australicus]
MSATGTYRAVQVAASGALELTERPLADPGRGQVRLRVEACGICHTDAGAVHPHPATEPGIVPGHEVVGIIDALGEGVTRWSVGERVGVGFLGGHCGQCASCRRGDFVNCQDQDRTGLTIDGGYAEYMVARETGLVAIPAEMTSVAAAPLLCAGITTFNALLKGAPEPGDLVAIQGIGGLGHLALQYADRMGLRVAAIARGTAKEGLSTELGADHYIDSAATDPGDELAKLGGASVIVTTVASGASSSSLIAGLADRGRLVVVGASSEPVTVSTGDLIGRGIAVLGSLTGTPIENERGLAFAHAQGVKALIEERPLADAAAAFDRMLSGEARFRMVLVP